MDSDAARAERVCGSVLDVVAAGIRSSVRGGAPASGFAKVRRGEDSIAAAAAAEVAGFGGGGCVPGSAPEAGDAGTAPLEVAAEAAVEGSVGTSDPAPATTAVCGEVLVRASAGRSASLGAVAPPLSADDGARAEGISATATAQSCGPPSESADAVLAPDPSPAPFPADKLMIFTKSECVGVGRGRGSGRRR